MDCFSIHNLRKSLSDTDNEPIMIMHNSKDINRRSSNASVDYSLDDVSRLAEEKLPKERGRSKVKKPRNGCM